MTPLDATLKAKAAFPFPGYFEDDMAAHLTVGETVGRYLKPGSRLFDFGSGACDKTAVAAALGCKCDAMDDLADDWYSRAGNIDKIEHFAKEQGIAFSRSYAPPKPETFDMVMLNDVMEHIHDSPRLLLNGLVDGLKTGGFLFITVPNLANIRKRIDLLRGRTNLAPYDLYYWYEGVWRGPQREYVRGDLEALSRNLGLEIVELRTVHHMLGRLPGSVLPVYKAVTALFPGWRDTWLLVAKKPQGWTPRLTISEKEFASIYGRTSKESLYGG